MTTLQYDQIALILHAILLFIIAYGVLFNCEHIKNKEQLSPKPFAITALSLEPNEKTRI